MNYSFNIYDDNEILTNLKTPHFVNVYFIISGILSFQKLDTNHIYHQGDIFVVYDFEETFILKKQSIIACISINNITYNRFTFIHKHSINDKQSNQSLSEIYIETLSSIIDNDTFNSDIGVIKLINCLPPIKSDLQINLSYSNKLIKNVVDYINKNYKSTLSLSYIAKIFYVNPSYLSREFSKKMNISLIKYIKKVKIYNLSRDILANGNFQSTWRDYGFSSYNTYLRDFKHIMGVSPKVFLEQNQANNNALPSNQYQLYNKIRKYLQIINSTN